MSAESIQPEVTSELDERIRHGKLELVVALTPLVLIACNVLNSTDVDHVSNAMIGVVGSLVPISIYGLWNGMFDSKSENKFDSFMGSIVISSVFGAAGYALGPTSTIALASGSAVARVGFWMQEGLRSAFNKDGVEEDKKK